MAHKDNKGTSHSDHGLFGIPTTLENSALALIPIPWEVTTSYGSGASEGPEAILQASPQLDLFDLRFGEAWRKGLHWMEASKELISLNSRLKPMAQEVIRQWEEQRKLNALNKQHLEEVNQGCKKMVWHVHNQSKELLQAGKTVAVVGGDHSSPEGLIQALSDKYDGDFGILHVDAHCDLRMNYQGFEHSHASIMHNVLNYHTPPQKLVQVGIRDFCKQEYEYSQSDKRICTFWDRECKSQMSLGKPWALICSSIVSELPHKVYVSFDIDGLSPECCPNTGTPVPGGLSFDEALLLLETLGKSNKKIIGFDLNEVAPARDRSNEWDGNVGSRILYQLCGWTTLNLKTT